MPTRANYEYFIACHACADGTPSLAAGKIMLMMAATVVQVLQSGRTLIAAACRNCNTF